MKLRWKNISDDKKIKVWMAREKSMLYFKMHEKSLGSLMKKAEDNEVASMILGGLLLLSGFFKMIGRREK